MDSIFGSGPSVEKGSSLDANQKAIADRLKTMLMGNLGKEGTLYGGDTAAGINDTQGTARTALNQLINSNVDENTMEATKSAIARAMSGIPIDTGEYFDKAIKAPTLEDFQENVLPQISESFAGPGTYWGSARAEAESKAMTDLASSLAGKKAEIQYNANENALNRALSAIPAGLQVANNPISVANDKANLTNLLFGMGTQEQATEQNAKDKAYQEYLRTRPENSNYLNLASQYLSTPMMYAYLNQGSPGILGSLAQGIGAAGGASAFFSDRRLKTNIVKKLELVKNLFVYEFEYIWDKMKVLGVMADEVEKIFPKSVVTHESGYKMVDYSRLAREVGNHAY